MGVVELSSRGPHPQCCEVGGAHWLFLLRFIIVVITVVEGSKHIGAMY